MLPKLHLLGAGSVVRVLAFYTHFQFCEGLKRSLFQHIEGHAKSKTALTELDVHLLAIQNTRVCLGLKSLIQQAGAKKLSRFGLLPLEYHIPTTKEVTAMVNDALVQESRLAFLSDDERRRRIVPSVLKKSKV